MHVRCSILSHGKKGLYVGVRYLKMHVRCSILGTCQCKVQCVGNKRLLTYSHGKKGLRWLQSNLRFIRRVLELYSFTILRPLATYTD